MNYSFNIEVAKEIGVDESIMLENFVFWIRKNIANGTNFHDGEYWTYNSVRAFSELFPFWTKRQIERILKSLENQGCIITGNYNDRAYDRKKWYALTPKVKSIYAIGEMDITKNVNGNNQNVEPIADINTNIKKDNIYIEQSSKEVDGGLLLQPDTIETKIKDKQPSKSKKDFSLEINEIRSYYKGTKSKKVADNKIPKLIKEYTKDQLIRAIERYNNYVESERRKGFKTLKYKNESTWWNGGFIDYLDDEYNAQEQTLFDVIKTPEKALQTPNNSILDDDIDFNY